MNTPTEDLVEEIYAHYRFRIPVLDRDAAVADPQEGEIEVYDGYFSSGYRGGREGHHKIRGSVVELTVPFSGDKDFFFIRPTSFTLSPPRAYIEKTHVVLLHKARELQPEQANAALNKVLDGIEGYLKNHRSTADPFNERLKVLIRESIEARKAKVLKDRNSASSLGFKLKARSDAPQTYVAPVTRKKIEVKQAPRQNNQNYQPEPVLDEAMYQEILGVIENMTHVMERSPSAFKDMGEENLRQHYLVQLNGRYEGAASGETFNYKGKTDILIREKDRNIFIAECKFWTGPKAFQDTIDQLLGYLSWRDTKAAVIMFNKNKDFSAVVKNMVSAANEHAHKKRGPQKEGETRFRYVFGNPTDHNREVQLTIMAFNIPQP